VTELGQASLRRLILWAIFCFFILLTLVRSPVAYALDDKRQDEVQIHTDDYFQESLHLIQSLQSPEQLPLDRMRDLQLLIDRGDFNPDQLSQLRENLISMLTETVEPNPNTVPKPQNMALLGAVMSIDFRLNLGKDTLDQPVREQFRIQPDQTFHDLHAAVENLGMVVKDQTASELVRKILEGFTTIRKKGIYEEHTLIEQELKVAGAYAKRHGVSIQEARDHAVLLGEENFLSKIQNEDSSTKIDLPGFGKAEVNSADGIKFIRLVHQASGNAILFLDSDKIDPNSKHVRKIISRRIESGKTRSDGMIGRNDIVVWYSNGNSAGISKINRVEYYENPEMFSENWWTAWLWATVSRLRTNDFGLGASFGLLQGAAIMGLTALSNAGAHAFGLWHVMPYSLSTLAFTVFYGTLIGTLANNIRPWELRGSHNEKVIKKFVKSAGYSYPFTIFMTGDPLVGLSLVVLQTHARIIFNFYINGTGKVYWQRITEILDRKRISSKSFNVPILHRVPFVGERFFVWPGGSTTYQAVELGTAFPPKILDLGKYLGVHIPGLSETIPAGKIVFVSSVPLAMYSSAKLAEKVGDDKVEEYRADWENFKAGSKNFVRSSISLPWDVVAYPFSRNRIHSDRLKSRIDYVSSRTKGFVFDGLFPLSKKTYQAIWSLTKIGFKYRANIARFLGRTAYKGAKLGIRKAGLSAVGTGSAGVRTCTRLLEGMNVHLRETYYPPH